ncbi:MAG: ChbG/HpnK family deacetylase [Rickettsiales bacterium]|nr:ChbG/HpnK family deacetylase [Rickettsiales bacterium]
MKIRINADDFGISAGVNTAIEEMFQKQKLNSASLIFGCGFFDEAITIAKNNPDLKIGLHFNLSSGKAAFKHQQPSLLVDEKGQFKNGFLQLLLLSIFKKEQLLKEISLELEAQISAIISLGLKLNHIDSHRHVHFIPRIFQIVVEIAAKHQISQIRVINENLLTTWSIKNPKTFLKDGGIIKWLVLRFMGLINGSRKIKQSYFFSILYTCKISRELISKIKIPKNFDEVEIMIHPGNPEIDAHLKDLHEAEHLFSPNRNIERLGV